MTDKTQLPVPELRCTRTQTHRHLNSILGATIIVMLVMAPFMVVFPQEAKAQERAIQGAEIATNDMAVTERVLEQVSVPEEYVASDRIDADSLRKEEQSILPAGQLSTNESQDREEVALARALVSSPTAILGVTFPHNNAEENLSMSYRTRQADVWSEWNELEMAEAHAAPEYVEWVTYGTEPLPLVNVNEVEVAVKTADGRSLPGAVLTLIEPELESADLHDAQKEIHGEQAIEAVESLLDDVTSSVKHQEGNSLPESSSEEEKTELLAEETQGEDARGDNLMELPVAGATGAQAAVGSRAFVRALGTSSDGRSYTTEMPGLTITTRKGWGADERLMDWTPETVTFKGAVVHHTAGSNNYTKQQVPGLVKGIYRYHAVSLGWGDVGYHLLVDKFGGVWEGRAGGLTNSIEGGHALGANATTFGVSVLGDYTRVKPSDEALDAVAKAIAWKLKIHKINNLDATFKTKGRQWGKSSIDLPVVSAHRHVGGTTCPGDAFMSRWDELQQKVRAYTEVLNKAKYQGSPTPPQPTPVPPQQAGAQWAARVQIGRGWDVGQMLSAGGFSGPGRTDALLIDSAGELWLYPGVEHRSFPFARKHIGTGWGILDQISAGTDFDGDDIPDIIGRRRSNGDLLLYPGNGHGGFKAIKRIGTRWDVFTDIHVVPGMSGGNPVVYGVEESGNMRAYATNGRAEFTSISTVGSGWENMRSLNSVGNKIGDASSDLIAIDRAGRMWLYEGNGHGVFRGRVEVGQGWQGYNPVKSSGDSGKLWAVRTDGALFLYDLIAYR